MPGRGPSWFENEAFWDVYAPLMFDGKRWAETPDAVEALEASCALRPGDRILDACCGPGRHSVEFARKGYRVTGVDITPSYLAAAGESARDSGVSPEFVLADMRRFSRPDSFDLCVNLFTSFGYCDDPEDDLLILRTMYRSLVPGGRFALEMIGKETAARDFVPGETFDRDGWSVSTSYEVVGHWEGLKNRWVARNAGVIADHSFVQRLYSGVEMARALSDTGFRDVRIAGTLAGAPYDQEAPSLVAFAVR